MRSRAMKKTKMMSKHSSILCLLLMTILLMGIGYSAINSITGEISGMVIAEQQNDVFITSVEYVSDVDADLAGSNITYYKGTYMQSTVKLSETNASSEITYKVTVYNNSENTYPFLTTLFDEEFYDNPNIVFEIKDTGFKIGDTINGKETKEIYITFKYKDGVLPNNKTLNSNINFKIANPNRLVLAEDVISTGNYLGSTIAKDKIETVNFELGVTAPAGATASFDASEKQDRSVIGYYIPTDNGLYELTFLSDSLIAPNVNGQYLFQNLTSLKEISFNNFTTYGVTNMPSMFSDCSGLISLDVSKFDTSKVIDMHDMFQNCSGLANLDLSNFNTAQVTDMNSMFYGCSGLTSLNISNFNTINVKNMSSMFLKCSSFTSLDVSKFDTSKVENMKEMFYECSALTTLDVTNFNTSNVTDMSYMFNRCKLITALNVSEFDTSKVTNMKAMFAYCEVIPTLDVSHFDTSQVTDMSEMFAFCRELTSLNVSGFDTSNVTDLSYMFYVNLKNTILDISNWNTSKVQNMEYLFGSCDQLTELDVANWDTSNVTNMQGVFFEVWSVTKINISNWKTDNVLDMSYMFHLCSKLTELDLSKWNTSKVTDMSWMFYACSGLTELDVSSFDTRQVTNMSAMFYVCSKLTTIYVSEYDEVAGTGWTTSAVTDSSDMFTGSTKLVGQNGTAYSSSHVDAEYARIDKEGEPGYLTDIKNKVNRLVLAQSVDSTGKYLGSIISKDKIESIKFENGTTMEAISSFDASEKQDGSIIGYYTDTDNNGLYELTFLSEGTIAPNVNGQYLFQYLSNLKEIIFNNFTTHDVTNMNNMFSYSKKLISLDVSRFDVSKVTNMEQIFFECNNLTSLDLSEWNTNQVTNMKGMFSGCNELMTIYVREYNNVTQKGWSVSNVINSNEMFKNCYKLVGEDGTQYDENYTDAKYAKIDDINGGKIPSTIYDSSGNNSEGLHIGDFINYDAGTWTQEEINSIKTGKIGNLSTANGSTQLPSKASQFGGFVAGSSRNGNATPFNKYYDYIKDLSTGQAITGWRVFDIEGNTITLISAGNPEDYFHMYQSNYSYVSEYILTGNINSSWSSGSSEATKYQKRNWSQYINTAQKAKSVEVLTKNKLNDWYTKYINVPNANVLTQSTYQKIYTSQYQKYQNIIDNNSFYMLYTPYDSYDMCRVHPSMRYIYTGMENIAFGVRILITLSSDAKIEKVGTKTLTGGNMDTYGGNQTYNVWSLGNPGYFTEKDTDITTNEIITPQTLKAEDYGGQVSNYKPTNGSTVGWKIFHTDGQNIYLIADNYISNQYKPKGKKGTNYSSSNGTYGSNLNAAKDYAGITDILSSLKTKWLNKYTYTSTYYNMRATAYLLDTNVWSTFKDSAGYADYAVGAPTLELFTASYNVTHDTDINVQASSSTGYKMKWSNSSTYSNEITGLDTTESLYIINNLYNRTVFGTWLASPNANSSSSVFLVRCTDPQNSSSARINYAAYTSNGGGLRPVVVLKSNYGLEVQADGTYKITEINQ